MHMFLFLQVAGQVAKEAAKAVTTLPQGAEQATEIVPFLTTAALIVYAQKWLKSTGLYGAFVEKMPGADKWAHRLVASIGALWTALGLDFAYDGSGDAGYTFRLITPATVTMLHGLGDFAKVYVMQQVVYDATQKGKQLLPPTGPAAKP